jgi:hypothetical protein
MANFTGFTVIELLFKEPDGKGLVNEDTEALMHCSISMHSPGRIIEGNE